MGCATSKTLSRAGMFADGMARKLSCRKLSGFSNMENNLQLLYFGAEHCSMCRTAKPQFKEICTNLGLREGTDYMILDTDECDEQ